jgi:glycosyltransferase involved in cell wall biosynthesis
MMKIVHVIPALTKGGAERIVAELANHAVDQGHLVTIVAAAAAPAELWRDQLRPEVAVRYVGPAAASARSGYARLLPWLASNRRWLFDQDVVHCHLTWGSVFGTAIQMLRAFARGGSPVVVETYHSVGIPIPRWKRSLHALLLARRDAVAFMAEDDYWSAYKARRPALRVEVIPNGVSPPRSLDPAASENYRCAATRIPKGALVVGSIGRLVPERTPQRLIAIFAEILRLGVDAHLLLAGEGSERAKLEEEIRNRKLEQFVDMPGLVLNPAEPLGLIDLYLTINVGPITGVAALEAAFSAVPVIALQLQDGHHPGPAEWIWSSTDPNEVARHASQLLQDPVALRALAARQQAYVRSHHSVEVMAKAYDRLYEAELARPRRPAGGPQLADR